MKARASAREIGARLSASRRSLVETIGALDDATLDRPDPAGGWSARQQVDHIDRSERAFLILLRLIRIKETVLPWTRRRDAEPGPIDFSYDGLTIRSPRLVRPRGRPSVPALLVRLERTRANSLEVLDRRTRIAGRGALWPHPAFGALDSLQWLAVAALHERHHVEQIRRLLA